MTDRYTPPYRITPGILHSIEQIGEALGNLRLHSGSVAVPVLRRGNRIKTIQASLAIEGNSLSLEQVTAVLSGKRVLAQPREIQEVRNAFAAYEKLTEWTAHSRADLLAAHGLLMTGLVDEIGRFRSGSVGIQRDREVIHVAPPAARVSELMDNLLAWIEKTDEHPLVASCVFHYEFEFIHPFEDGNGRLGRLWQTLILTRWRPIFALLPVESIIHDRQQAYYAALGQADHAADATSFIEFMLAAILRAIEESALMSDQVSDHQSDQVMRLIIAIGLSQRSASDLMIKLGLSHRPTFRKNYLHPALEAGLIEMTQPDNPRARNQKYRLTAHGVQLMKAKEG
jgi:Fic family protein